MIDRTVKAHCKVLRESSAFAYLNDELLEDIAQHSKVLILGAGEKVILRHSERQEIFIISSGSLSFTYDSHQHGKKILDKFARSTLIGTFNSKLTVNGTISFVANEQVSLLRLPSKIMNTIWQSAPDAMFHFEKSIRHLIYRAQFAVHMSSLFDFHEPSALSELLEGVEWKTLSGGELLYRQGGPGDSIYMVLAGRMRATIDEGNGRHRLVTEMVPGETVGEVALLTNSDRAATLMAARDTVLAKLSASGFDRLTETHPQIALQIARLIATRLRGQLVGKTAKVHKGSTFAVIPTQPEFDTSDFVASLWEAMKFTGSTALFSARDLDRELGLEGVSQEQTNGIRRAEISRWFHEQEATYENIILIADSQWSNWSERAVRQADHLLFIADADAEDSLGEHEKRINALWDFSSHLKQSLVLLHSSDTSEISNTNQWLSKRRIKSFYHVRFGFTEDYARLSRLLTGQANALVLGGGGARGFAHIGVIKALEENGVNIDVVGGTSFGGVIGAGVALGYDSKNILKLCRKHIDRIYDFTFPVISLLRGKKIEQKLEAAFGSKQIEDLLIPFFCVSTNLTRAEQVVHNRGSLVKSLRASISLPAMVPPVLKSGDMLVDGGVLNNLPVDVMSDLYSGGKIIAVDISPKVDLANNDTALVDGAGPWLLLRRLNPFRRRHYVPSIFDVLSRSITLSAVNKSMRKKEQDLASLYLLLPVDAIGTLEYDQFEKIADLGYAASIKQVTDWCRGNEVS